MSPTAFRKEGLRGGFRFPINAMKDASNEGKLTESTGS